MKFFIEHQRRKETMLRCLDRLEFRDPNVMSIKSACGGIEAELEELPNMKGDINKFYKAVVFLREVTIISAETFLKFLTALENAAREKQRTVYFPTSFFQAAADQLDLELGSIGDYLKERGYRHVKKLDGWHYDWMDRRGYFYVVMLGDMFKVGRTRNMEQRLGTYRDSYPFAKLLFHQQVEDRFQTERIMLDYIKSKGVNPIPGRKEFFMELPPSEGIIEALLEAMGAEAAPTDLLVSITFQIDDIMDLIEEEAKTPYRRWWFYLHALLKFYDQNIEALIEFTRHRNNVRLQMENPELEADRVQQDCIRFLIETQKKMEEIVHALNPYIGLYQTVCTDEDILFINALTWNFVLSKTETWKVLKTVDEMLETHNQPAFKYANILTPREAIDIATGHMFPDFDIANPNDTQEVDLHYMCNSSRTPYTSKKLGALSFKKRKAVLAMLGMIVANYSGNTEMANFARTVMDRRCLCGSRQMFGDCCQLTFAKAPVSFMDGLVSLTEEGWMRKGKAEARELEEFKTIHLTAKAFVGVRPKHLKSKQTYITDDRVKLRELMKEYGAKPNKYFIF